MHQFLSTVAFSGLLAVSSMSPASAVTFTTTATARGPNVGGPVCSTEATPMSSSASNETSIAVFAASGDGCVTTSTAAAGAGYASSVSYAAAGPSSPGGETLGGATFFTGDLNLQISEGYTEAFISDLYPSGQIEITLAALFSGEVEAKENSLRWNYGGGLGSRASATVTFGSAVYEEEISANASGFDPYNLDVFSRTIRLTQTIDWTDPLTVQMTLGTRAGAYNIGFGSNGYAGADASQTLSFDPTGPAFILPEGLTVHSPELGIFNNQWIDPRGVTVAPVPLPATLPLLLVGVGFLLAKRQKV